MRRTSWCNGAFQSAFFFVFLQSCISMFQCSMNTVRMYATIHLPFGKRSWILWWWFNRLSIGCHTKRNALAIGNTFHNSHFTTSSFDFSLKSFSLCTIFVHFSLLIEQWRTFFFAFLSIVSLSFSFIFDSCSVSCESLIGIYLHFWIQFTWEFVQQFWQYFC